MKKLFIAMVFVVCPVICYSGISQVTDVKLSFDISISKKGTEITVDTDTLKEELYKEAYSTLTNELADLNIIGRNNTGMYALSSVVSILEVKESKSYVYVVRMYLTCTGTDKIGKYNKRYWEKLHYGITTMDNMNSTLKARIKSDISAFAKDWYEDLNKNNPDVENNPDENVPKEAAPETTENPSETK